MRYNACLMSRTHFPTGAGCRRVPVEDPELKDHPRVFALQMGDEAMSGRHIIAGDVLIFEHGLEPRSGDVIAAFVDGQSVVRSYVVQDGRPFFKAAHPSHTDLIPAEELVIQGTLVRLIREYR
jgi:repressor LexA